MENHHLMILGVDMIISKDITNRYRRKILEVSPVLKSFCDENNPSSLWHLLWMLDMIDNELDDDLKCHRWLGYIQGILVSQDIIDVMGGGKDG